MAELLLPAHAGVILCGARVHLRERAFIDIDSLLRPVYGCATQGASFGHTKIAGKDHSAPRIVPAGGHDLHRDRGDCAFCACKVVAAVVKAGARFSFAIARNPAVDAAIAKIGDEQYTPVRYPGAVTDPDTGELISDAQVAEVEFTAFAGTRYEINGWLVVRRVLDANTAHTRVRAVLARHRPHRA